MVIAAERVTKLHFVKIKMDLNGVWVKLKEGAQSVITSVFIA